MTRTTQTQTQRAGAAAPPQPATALLIGGAGRGKTTCIRDALRAIAEGSIIREALRSVATADVPSIVVLDQGGELHDTTATALERTHDVRRLAVLAIDADGDGNGYGWNPLATCHDHGAAWLLADTWVRNTTDVRARAGTATWRSTDRVEAALIAAAALRLTSEAAARGTAATLPALAALVAHTPPAAPLGASGAAALQARFAVLDDPRVRALVARDDYRPDHLTDPSRRPLAVFVTWPRADAALLRPLLALLVGQTLTAHRNTSALLDDRRARPVLVCLDDLASLGIVPGLAHALAVGAHHGIATIAALADVRHLHALYGPEADAVLAAFTDTIVLDDAHGTAGAIPAGTARRSAGRRTSTPADRRPPSTGLVLQ